MKSIISLVCLVVLVAALGQQQVEARPKRSVFYAAAPAVAVAGTVPVVRTAAVVHQSPTSSVVKTEQVHDGVGSSYSYSSEVKTAPVVHHHAAVAAVPAVAAVSTVHHTVPAYAYSYYHPAAYAYYSPYHHFGK